MENGQIKICVEIDNVRNQIGLACSLLTVLHPEVLSSIPGLGWHLFSRYTSPLIVCISSSERNSRTLKKTHFV